MAERSSRTLFSCCLLIQIISSCVFAQEVNFLGYLNDEKKAFSALLQIEVDFQTKHGLFLASRDPLQCDKDVYAVAKVEGEDSNNQGTVEKFQKN